MKLEVGMYVRFNDLTNYNQNNIVMIDKIKFISEIMCGLEETLSITFEKYNEDVLKKDIIKASYDILDLIEEGDYVNGYKIDYINSKCETPFLRSNQPYRVDNTLYSTLVEKGKDYNQPLHFYNEDIKSIVTKERFDATKYEVE